MNLRIIRLPSRLIAIALVLPFFISLDQHLPVNASVAVATPTSSNSTITGFAQIGSGLSISGFSSNIRVVLSTNDADGELKLATSSGLTAVLGYDNSTSLTDPGDEIAFEGSQANANAALVGLEYKGASVGSDSISIEVIDAGISPVILSGVYHYYGLSSGATTFSYTNAKTGAATPRTINGISVTPWLATVGSSAENLAISNYVNADAWIGGEVTSTSGTVRTWQWVTSNSADGLSGVSFATDTYAALPCVAGRGGPTTMNGYQNWYDYRDDTLTINTTGLEFTEPNNCSGGLAETSLIMYSQRKNIDGSTWNDVRPGELLKYIWEYASPTPLSLNATFAITVTDPSASSPGPSAAGSPATGTSSPASSISALAKTGESLTYWSFLAAAIGAAGTLLVLLAQIARKNLSRKSMGEKL